jgi:hypothetical protein
MIRIYLLLIVIVCITAIMGCAGEDNKEAIQPYLDPDTLQGTPADLSLPLEESTFDPEGTAKEIPIAIPKE